MPPHVSVTPLNQAGTNTTIALTDFRMLLLEALDKKTLPEMTRLGMQDTSDMLETRYPVSVADPIFKALVADNPEYMRIGEVFFELFSDVFQVGAAESAQRLRTAEWARRGWGSLPVKFAGAVPSLFERLLAGTASANAYTPRIGGFKGGESVASCENLGTSTSIKVFQKQHPVNPLKGITGGTYDNLYTGAATGTGEGLDADTNYPGALPLNVNSVRIIRNLFGTQLSPNGLDPRGYDLTHIVCGKDLEETALTITKDDNLLVVSSNSATPAADSPMVLRPNPLKKYKPIQVLINPFLNEAGVWYACAADESGELPWMTLLKIPNNSGRVAGMPGPAIVMADGIEWIVDDEISETYKHGSKVAPAGHVAIAGKIEAAAGITLPWRIKRCKAT